jgi:hypothetical protein
LHGDHAVFHPNRPATLVKNRIEGGRPGTAFEEYNAVLALARKGIPEQSEITKGNRAAGTAAKVV